MDVAVAFGKVLRRLRLKAGHTQEELALEANLRRTFISVLELGHQQPTLSTIVKLAGALDLPAREMIGMVEEEVARGKLAGRRSKKP